MCSTSEISRLLSQLGAQWERFVDIWKPDTACFLSDHHKPTLPSATRRKKTAVAMAADLFVTSLWEHLGMTHIASGSDG